ncbi:glycoside hydrolase family 5 protein [Marinagarivorans algicola]|uniref:glycoside hydrolase family 5 protein n=1 Tax=Marinagarivorans algicola TaxID=1513270 RepID=UPI0037357BAA
MKQSFGLAPQKLLSVMLFGSTLAACGGGSTTPTPPTASSQVSVSSAAPTSSSVPPAVSSVISSSSVVSSISVVSSTSVVSSSVAPSSSSQPPVVVSSIASSSSVSSVSNSSMAASSAGSAGVGTLLDSDGTFANGQALFTGNIDASLNASFTWDGEVNVTIPTTSTETWHAQLIHAIGLTQDEQYTICFRIKASAERTMGFNIDQGGSPGYASLLSTDAQELDLTTSYQNVKHTFTAVMTDTSARLTMSFGVLAGNAVANVQVDDIGVYAGAVCGDPSQTPAVAVGSGSDNIVGVPAITTEGNQVLFGGQTGSIAGMSLFWSSHGDGSKFYNQNVVEKLSGDWNARLIRAAMGINEGDGYLNNPGANKARVEDIVQQAIANDMYVIIDWHTHDAEEHPANLAPEFFAEMATTYGANNHVIYEIYNEPDCSNGLSGANCGWDEKTTWAEIKAYALPVIRAIRAIDPDNLIIVGTPYYSQFVDEASEDPIVAADFPDNAAYADNIAYTLHFYAGSHKQQERNRAITALKNGIPLFVTEWGSVGASGDGAFDKAESDTWMEFLYDNNISHANWSISDKAEGASILKPGSNGANGWNESDLTETGLYVKDKIKNW